MYVAIVSRRRRLVQLFQLSLRHAMDAGLRCTWLPDDLPDGAASPGGARDAAPCRCSETSRRGGGQVHRARTHCA